MKRRNWYLVVGATMVAISALSYFLHYLIFKDVHHIFIYMLGDFAFVFLEVLLVTLIIHQLLTERDKRVALEKLNMVIGAFFDEVGRELLRSLSAMDPHRFEKLKSFAGANDWKDRDFIGMRDRIQDFEFKVHVDPESLRTMKKLLSAKREFLVRLLENPLLLEHESFTSLLLAVFHFTDELESRIDFSALPESDIEHLSGDASRVYGRLVYQWLGYMLHLKKNYPYLFSLAARLNPFNPEATAVVG